MAALDSNPHLHILIIAGGSGTRFWPRSRQGKPKQLLKFWDDHTLLEHTVHRFLVASGLRKRVWIVTTENLVSPSREVLGKAADDVHFLGEPVGKNTAPCILWGLREIHKADPEAIVCIVPADHYIGDEPAFRSSLARASELAMKTGGIVTLGIKPNRPETGYGYNETESAVTDHAPVSKFVEKPGLRDALRFVSSGKYLWNAGLFIMSASVGLDAFTRCMPKLQQVFDQYSSKGISGIYENIDPHDAVSIDYGVMELAQEKGIPVSVIPVDFEWNDLGSYTALEDIDKAVKGNVVSHNAASNIVQSDHGLVALLGVNDLIVVREGDIVLVAAKDRCQDIRKLVERVKKEYPNHA